MVRMTREQQRAMQDAMAWMAAGRPGLRPILSRFLLESGIEVATRVLAEKAAAEAKK